MWVLLAGAPWLGLCAAPASAGTPAEAAAPAAPHEEHGLTPNALGLGPQGNSFVTSSMVVTWIVAIGLIVLVRYATRNVQLVPSGAQNFWEWLVETLYEFLEGIIGADLVKKTFWFFATIFIFILFTNWFGLIPGVGTIGWGEHTPAGLRGYRSAAPRRQRGPEHDLGHVHDLLRLLDRVGGAGDGRQRVFLDLFGPKGDTTGVLKLLMIVVFFAVGFLEVLSILFRPISLSFRLYGNIFAGENMLEAMATTGARALAGCCRCRSISWNCWWGSCRRWCSCC